MATTKETLDNLKEAMSFDLGVNPRKIAKEQIEQTLISQGIEPEQAEKSAEQYADKYVDTIKDELTKLESKTKSLVESLTQVSISIPSAIAALAIPTSTAAGMGLCVNLLGQLSDLQNNSLDVLSIASKLNIELPDTVLEPINGISELINNLKEGITNPPESE